MTSPPSFSWRFPLFLALLAGISPRASVAGPVDYTNTVKPILKVHCYSCHGPRIQKGKLRVDTAKLMLKGGRNGPAFVPGKSGESLLIEKITHGKAPSGCPRRRKTP